MSSDCVVTEYEDDSSFSFKDSLEGVNFKGGETTESSIDESLTELEKLIYILKKGIKKNEPGIKVIKYT